MGFLYALIALLSWSGSDLFSKLGSSPDDKTSHLKMVAVVGLAMGIHALIEITAGGVPVSWESVLAYLPASLLYIGAMVLGYAGLRYIELSVSSPICNASGALASLVLIVYAAFASGGSLTSFFEFAGFMNTAGFLGTLAGVSFAGGGVIMLGIVEQKEDAELKRLRREKENVRYTASVLAIVLPLLYLVLDAGGTTVDAFLLQTMDEETANVSYELTFFALGLLSALYLVFVKKERPVFKEDGWKALAAVCETAGQFFYVFALSENPVMSAPVISCYCAVSVLWSRIFLKEKLSKKHYVAILLTVIGIALLGAFGGE